MWKICLCGKLCLVQITTQKQRYYRSALASLSHSISRSCCPLSLHRACDLRCPRVREPSRPLIRPRDGLLYQTGYKAKGLLRCNACSSADLDKDTAPSSLRGADVYAVERIVKESLVLWKDYPKEDSSLVLEKDITLPALQEVCSR